MENEARARELTEHRVRKLRDVRSAGAGARTLEQMMKQAGKDGKKEFLLIIKGDVQGSIEAINAALEKLGTEEVGARIIHWAVGGIASSDVALAEASGAIIVAFNVRADTQAKQQAERDGIEICYYNIIYDLVDDVKKAMSGLLPPLTREEFLGNASVLEVFNISKVGKVAGCRVTEGKVERGAACGSSATMWSSTRASSRRSSASRMRFARCRWARNAAWRSKTTTTSSRVTRSSASAPISRLARFKNECGRLTPAASSTYLRGVTLCPEPRMERCYGRLQPCGSRQRKHRCNWVAGYDVTPQHPPSQRRPGCRKQRARV